MFQPSSTPAHTTRVHPALRNAAGALGLLLGCVAAAHARGHVVAAAPGDTGAVNVSPSAWSYRDEPPALPPERWGEIPGCRTCSLGHHQSPIALFTTGDQAAHLAPISALTFAYRPTPLRVVDNLRFVSVLCDSGGTISLASIESSLIRMDVHAPSEHSMDGKQYPMELQFMHRSLSDGTLTLVSVFVTAGKKNDAFENLLHALPRQPGGTSNPSNVSFDASALVPGNHGYVDYVGSLTSPPCAENVRWCVLRTPIEVSQEQLARYTRDPRLAQTARPLMPANGRLVRMGAEP